MTSPVVTVTPDTSLRDAAAALVEHGINAMPVVDDGRRLVGIVSEADLLRPEQPHAAGAGRVRLRPGAGRGRYGR
jgi:CBS-domain-containing membrane protein